MPRRSSFERSLLRDPDVKFGCDHYELLKEIGFVSRQLRRERSVSALESVSKADLGVIDAAETTDGPSLLTLVRLARAAGKRLAICLQDADDDKGEPQYLVSL